MSELNASNFKKEEGGQGPDIIGTTEFTSPYFMVPPSGTTAQRPLGCAPGTLRFNTDIGSLEYFKGDILGWESIVKTTPNLGGLTNSAEGTGTRGLFAGGYISGSPVNPAFNNVDAITIETLGNTHDFNNLATSVLGAANFGSRTRCITAGGRTVSSTGSNTDLIQYCVFSTQGDYVDSGGDLTAANAYSNALSNQTRGIIAGGGNPYVNTIQYVTMASLGDAQDFNADLHAAKGYMFAMNSSTRGVIGGGVYCCPGAYYNTLEYVTIQTTGTISDFGDISTTRYEGATASSATRGVLMGGYGPGYTNIIEYLTMASLGNTVDFGDLTNQNATGSYSACSKTRGVFGGGYVAPATPYSNIIDYIQIATTGNSKDFGDFINFGRRSGSHSGASNNHGGL
jgi:hypothetical protein